MQLLEREREGEKERKRERVREIVFGYYMYTGYLLSIVKIKREWSETSKLCLVVLDKKSTKKCDKKLYSLNFIAFLGGSVSKKSGFAI